MSFLSKLFGNAVEKAANEVLKGVTNNNKPSNSQTQPQTQTYTQPQAAPEKVPVGPSGDSWGPVMPAEENQYNFNGTYVQYFEGIFNSEFPSYSISKTQDAKATVFTFSGVSGTALVVELLPENSGRFRLRKECEANGIPYLRFYYNHDGWWNTRSYVIRRTRAAIK